MGVSDVNYVYDVHAACDVHAVHDVHDVHDVCDVLDVLDVHDVHNVHDVHDVNDTHDVHDALTVLYANDVCDTCSFCDIFDVPDVRDVCEVPFALKSITITLFTRQIRNLPMFCGVGYCIESHHINTVEYHILQLRIFPGVSLKQRGSRMGIGDP
jgi:hypothetical protein